MWSRGIVIALVALTVVVATQAQGIRRCVDMGIAVSETTFVNASGIDDFQLTYTTNDNKHIFMRMRDGAVYRSRNGGASWELQTVNSKMAGIEQTPNGIWAIFDSAEDSGTRHLYLLSFPFSRGGQKMWVSENNGESYVPRLIPDGVFGIRTHSIFPNRALALRASGNTREALMTENSGRNWTVVTTELLNLGTVTWGFPNEHPNRIYAILGDGKHWNNRLVRTDDWFKTTTVVLEHVYTFALRNDDDIVAIQYTDPSNPRVFQLILSEDAGAHWHVAEFPDKGDIERREIGFTIYDTAEDAIFVGVWRDQNLPWADVYKSDSFDKDFTMSLEYHRPYDLTRFNGLDGIYIANRWNTTHPMDPIKEDDIDTVISFNKGGTWHLLNPPATRWSGEKSDCDVKKGCSLHLHGYNSGGVFSWFYSVPGAVGLMMATGNIGDELMIERDEVNTYVSRDAGVTWNEVAPGPYIPEFGDSGAIIVLAPEDIPTNYIKYSLNQGQTWVECSLREKDMEVTNIRTAPNWDSKQFILYGTSIGQSHPVVISLDFSRLAPNCEAKDYEEWSPVDEHGHCIMGEKLTFRRRKSDAICFNGEKFDHAVKSEPCLCSEADYECEFCFRYDEVLDKCVYDCFRNKNQTDFFLNLKPEGVCAPDSNRYYWEVPGHGYRKIADNKCDASKPNSVKKPDGLIPCNINRSPFVGPGPAAVVVILIVVLVVCVVVATVLLVWFRGASIRSWFGGPAPSEGGSAYDRVESLVDDEEEANADASVNGGVSTRLE